MKYIFKYIFATILFIFHIPLILLEISISIYNWNTNRLDDYLNEILENIQKRIENI